MDDFLLLFCHLVFDSLAAGYCVQSISLYPLVYAISPHVCHVYVVSVHVCHVRVHVHAHPVYWPSVDIAVHIPTIISKIQYLPTTDIRLLRMLDSMDH